MISAKVSSKLFSKLFSIFLFFSFISFLLTTPISVKANNLNFQSYDINPVPIRRNLLDKELSGIEINLVSTDTGWFLDNNHLFLTDNNGESWREITPPINISQNILKINFLNINSIKILLSEFVDNGLEFFVASSMDRGEHWEIIKINIPITAETYFYSKEIYMQWINYNEAWILFKEGTGINFSKGELFSTKNGGVDWSRSDVPIADSFSFISSQVGFLAGGPNETDLYRSSDGGSTWVDIRDKIKNSTDSSLFKYSLPVFTSDDYGLLAVYEKNQNTSDQVLVFASSDFGLSWQLKDSFSILDNDSDQAPIFLQASSFEHYVLWVPGSSTIIAVEDGLFSSKNLAFGKYSIENLDFVDNENGWGKFVNNSCTKSFVDLSKEIFNCEKNTEYLYTKDGGITWVELSLNGFSKFTETYESIVQSPSFDATDRDTTTTEIFIGQGFDKCEIPTLSQMQTWINQSPYDVVNLYIGGACRACPNSALNADYVLSLYQQGWKFIPTWVGPQAPCSGFSKRMSWDTSTAYQEGVTNANQAAAVLSDLNLSLDDLSGSVVYYDIEAYSGDEACYDAVDAFLNGWTLRLHQLGILSGVYGSSCGSHLSNYFVLPNPPDVIWPAAWYHSSGSGYYDPDATVWNIVCISNTVYNNHQRIRQYEGGHSETWGGVALTTIDSNVLDGVVAVPNQGDNTPPTNPTTINPGCTATSGEWQNTCKDPSFSWSGATDNASGVAGYYYYWGTSSTGTSTSYTTSTSYNPPAVGEGTYYFRISTKDNQGNTAPWQTMFILKYDGTKPTGTLKINDGIDSTYKTLVTLSPTASDNLSGVKGIRFRDQGGVWTNWQGVNEIKWLLPAITNQIYRVECEIQDWAGNYSSVFYDDIYLDIYPDRPTSMNYSLVKSTFGMSATNASSSAYKLQGTLSQNSTNGISISENFRISSGYWSWILNIIQVIEDFFIYLPLLLR